MHKISLILQKDQVKIALYNKNNQILLKKDGSSNELAKHCLDMISEAGITKNEIEYLGIATDRDLGSPDDIAASVEKELGIRCYGASLMSARALGEAYLTNDVPYLVFLKIDTSVECGIVIDKKIFEGEKQLGGKVAHMVMNVGGYECSCGRRGCFETYVSLDGLRRIAAESGVADAESIDHKTLFSMTTPEAECAKERYVKYLACGITSIINLFQPNEFVLEGPFTEIGDGLMAPMMEIVLREQYSRTMPNKCTVRRPNDETTTALLGAALLGR